MLFELLFGALKRRVAGCRGFGGFVVFEVGEGLDHEFGAGAVYFESDRYAARGMEIRTRVLLWESAQRAPGQAEKSL